MGIGNYERQSQYFNSPEIYKSSEEIYSDLDSWTNEIFEQEANRFENVNFHVLLPPLLYQGKFIKGLYFSESVDLLNKLLPQLSEVFFSIADSLWCAYPWSNTADAYFCLYDHPSRADWFKKTYPQRANKVLIPFSESDFINEYLIAPQPINIKDIDIICVAKLSPVYNLPIIAKALKVYQKKYNKLLKMKLILEDYFEVNSTYLLSSEAQLEWQKIQNILVHNLDDIEIVSQVDYYQEMPLYYSRSKICLLGSLLEGKNRSLSEAMSCNTPVICFREFNQYVRGKAELFPPGSGLLSKFDPESLADTIHTALEDLTVFQPRFNYLKYRGRKNFFNTCLDSFIFYNNTIPDYIQGEVYNNVWLDLAMQYNYQISLHDFLYGRSPRSHLQGLVNIYKILNQWIKIKI
ncbi:glycosyltransferase [Planktothrix paucivesiculata]|uniref:Glycosyl transferase n=1 Tax=Planktothrix paucivesiculata PCC 9631 TaxID=671071 RepID=A0A7Z9C1N5_9CYAN|nr:glycosyltransferase [Planktothrix paucivesiculata]VXD23945.1 putative glycosyl transferase [Planktothrix paucivesiculata PCC 9631]